MKKLQLISCGVSLFLIIAVALCAIGVSGSPAERQKEQTQGTPSVRSEGQRPDDLLGPLPLILPLQRQANLAGTSQQVLPTEASPRSAAAPACLEPPSSGGKVLVRGAPIHGANGIIFDRADRLFIASVWGGEIVVMDPRTGKIIKRLGSEVGVQGPDDMAFGPDGSLYWTDLLTGEVGRLSPDGKTTKQFVAPGANPITFSNNGRLFVALCFFR